MGDKRTRSEEEEEGSDGEETEHSFEAERNAMIEENRRRMLALGLLDDANLFRSSSLKAARVAKQKLATSSSPAGPIRRSTRLQGITRVSYKDIPQYTTLLTYSPQQHASKLTRRPAYSGPVRRSSRLQDSTKVSYKEQLQDDTGVLPLWSEEIDED